MRHSFGRHYSLALHSDAEDDLDGIYEIDEDAAADIEVFLEEVKNNQSTLDDLTRSGYVKYGDQPFNVKEWLAAKKEKFNLWRLRLLWLEGASAKYRIIYAFDPQKWRYHVLGIVNRNFNYELNHERSKKIIAAYEDLGLPRY
jgi:hypothetical protein